jgi:hypothetical protein
MQKVGGVAIAAEPLPMTLITSGAEFEQPFASV